MKDALNARLANSIKEEAVSAAPLPGEDFGILYVMKEAFEASLADTF